MTSKENPFIENYDDLFEEYKMTAERANEILSDGSEFCNWSSKCSYEEKAYLDRIWDAMPPETCWYDALVRVSKSLEDGRE